VEEIHKIKDFESAKTVHEACVTVLSGLATVYRKLGNEGEWTVVYLQELTSRDSGGYARDVNPKVFVNVRQFDFPPSRGGFYKMALGPPESNSDQNNVYCQLIAAPSPCDKEDITLLLD